MLTRLLRLSPLCLLGLAACGGDKEPEVPPLTLVTTALPAGALGAAYDQKLEVSGGVPPYNFSVSSGALPDGLQILADQGRLTGNLEAPGPHAFEVQVKDASAASVTKDLTIYVSPDALAFVTDALEEAYTVTPYTVTLQTQGGVPPVSFALTDGLLATGLTLTPEGQLAGTPTETGTFMITVEANDAESTTAEATFMLTVRSGTPMIETETLLPGLVGDRYEIRLEATGGMAPYTWTVPTSTLPPGLQLQDDGLLFGALEAPGEYMFGVQVQDNAGQVDNKGYTLLAFEQLSVGTRTLPVAIVDEPYRFQLEADGGLAPYSWSTTDTLPPGMTLSAEGIIEGTASQIGSWPMRIRVQDGLQGVPRSARFTLRVQDVRAFEVTPAAAFPPICTATTVSYQTVEIPVPNSFAIQTITIDVDIDYADTNGNDRDRLKLVLWAPDGRRTVLCGNGAGVRGSGGCQGRGNLRVTYGGAGGLGTQVPLRVFDEMNAIGIWRLQAAVIKPTSSGGTCDQAGVIQSVRLTMEPDPSPDPYVIIGGFTYNNLLIDPWVRITGGGIDEHSISLSATLWHPGANGLREGGLGDDQPDPVQFTFSGTGLPTGTSVAPDGTVQAGPITTRGLPGSTVTAVDATGTFSKTLLLHVTTPDWRPMIRNY